MGANKNLFMDDREEEFFGFEKMPYVDPFETLSDSFVKKADDYEEGNNDALDTAIQMRKEYEALEYQMNIRKTWLDENKDAIESESCQYPDGYKGYSISLRWRETPNFKEIPEWIKLEKAKKDFETKCKKALKNLEKGIPNVDIETGEEIPLPEISTVCFLKFDKLYKE